MSPAELFAALNESEIARQLTLIESKLFNRIKSSELLNQSWNKPASKFKSPNVLAMISRANKLSSWIASLILFFKTVKQRAAILSKVISIAVHLRALHNYNTLMGLYAGINMGAIHRLKHTWAAISPETQQALDEIRELLKPVGSFKNYRVELSAASSKGAVLPYLGTMLSDLTFTEDGNKDFVEVSGAKLINWAKRELIGKLIAELGRYQKTPFVFPEVEPIYSFLSEVPFFQEKELYDLSLLREKKNAEPQDVL
jgi:hypothetical protein